MSIYTFLTVALCAFAILHWFAVPRLEASWSRNPTADKIATAGLLAGFRAARTLAQLALLTLAVVVAVLLIASLFFDTNSAQGYLNAIQALERYRHHLAAFSSKVIGNVAFWSAIAGLVWLAYRRQRHDLVDDAKQAAEREYERLMEQLKSSQWEELPPTDEMRGIQQQIQLVQREMEKPQQNRGAEISPAELAQLLQRLRERLFEIDVLRRMDLRTPVAPKHTSEILWPSLFQFFTSKGFVADSSKVGKACSYGGTALLVLSLLGAAAPAVTATLEGRIDSLWQLQVKATHDEAVRSWQAARAAAPAAIAPPAASQAQTQLLARAFVHAYVASDMWKMSTASADAAIRSALIRQEIIEQAPSVAQRSEANVRDVEDVLEGAKARARNAATQSDIERFLAGRVESDLRASGGGLWTKLGAKLSEHAKTYAVPAKASHFASALVDEILGVAVDGAVPKIDDEFAKQLSRLLTKGLKASLKQAIETRFSLFLADVSGDTPVDVALAKVSKARSDDLVPGSREELAAVKKAVAEYSQRVAKRYARAPPTLAGLVRTKPSDALRKRAIAAAQSEWAREKDRLVPRARTAVLRSLAEFDDYFAGTESARRLTTRSSIVADAGRPISKEQALEAFERSRNFAKLDASQYVGGIVIGRMPEAQDDRPDVVGFRWTVDAASRFALRFTHRNGTETIVSPAPADLLFRSLLYAADGRPMAVTILNTDVDAQKVLLHPSLEDSRLGCEIIELDRFVFSYIDPTSRNAIDKATDRLRVQRDLYTRAVSIGRYVVSSDRKGLEQPIVSSDGRLLAEIRDRSLFQDKAKSTFASAYSIYSPPVLRVIEGCSANAASSLKTFDQCIADQASSAIQTREDLKAWRHVSDLQIVSGVRDAKYNVDSRLELAKLSNGSSLRPLEFLVQDTSLGEDKERWLFPDVTPGLHGAVSRLVRENPEARSIVSGVRDFAVLQRLFRLAFAGMLGTDFPLHALVDLTSEARKHAHDELPTARWLPSGGSQTAELRKLLDRVYGRLANEERKSFTAHRQRMARCVTHLQRIEASGAAQAQEEKVCQPTDEQNSLSTVCRDPAAATGAACALVRLDQHLNSLAKRMALAVELGALVTTRQQSVPGRCGPLRAS